ncbi:hypothetical protein KSS87_012872 [Heliosperma pusillum]|nr:hypothetical protein KSS87_012872 [Heliosperma pusillum]
MWQFELAKAQRGESQWIRRWGSVVEFDYSLESGVVAREGDYKGFWFRCDDCRGGGEEVDEEGGNEEEGTGLSTKECEICDFFVYIPQYERPFRQTRRSFCAESDDAILEERRLKRENAVNGFFDECSDTDAPANLLEALYDADNIRRSKDKDRSLNWKGIGMDRVEGMYTERLQALLRAYNAARFVQDDNIPCQIEEGLFLGSLGAANNKPGLKGLNISHVLTVAGSLPPPHPHDFTYKVIEVTDREDTDLAHYFDECIDFIDEGKRSGGGVLVHCFVGRSRSVTVVLAYLLKKRGMMLSEALEYVRSKRPQASPNAGFIKQLQNYEQSLREIYAEIKLSIPLI